MTFGKQLQALRAELHHTAADAAQVFGCPPETLQGWERGREPKDWLQPILLAWFRQHARRKPAPSGPRPGRPLKPARTRRVRGRE